MFSVILENVKFVPFLFLAFCVLGCSAIENSPEWRAYEKAEARMNESPEKKAARDLIILNDAKQSSKSSASVLILNLEITNKNSFTVKDFMVVCDMSGKSGTKIHTITKTVFESVPANKTVTIKDINFGFMNSQTTNFQCEIDDFAVVQ